jgi:hypothetical protein
VTVDAVKAYLSASAFDRAPQAMDLSVSEILSYLEAAARPTKKLKKELSTCLITDPSLKELKKHIKKAQESLERAKMVAIGQQIGSKMPVTPQDHEQKTRSKVSQKKQDVKKSRRSGSTFPSKPAKKPPQYKRQPKEGDTTSTNVPHRSRPRHSTRRSHSARPKRATKKTAGNNKGSSDDS